MSQIQTLLSIWETGCFTFQLEHLPLALSFNSGSVLNSPAGLTHLPHPQPSQRHAPECQAPDSFQLPFYPQYLLYSSPQQWPFQMSLTHGKVFGVRMVTELGRFYGAQWFHCKAMGIQPRRLENVGRRGGHLVRWLRHILGCLYHKASA